MITAAPRICLTPSLGGGSVSRKELARRIGERNEVDNCGFGVAQRPEDYHTQHRQLELKMTKLRGDIDFERSDAPMCRVRIATLWSGGRVNLTGVRIFMQLGNGTSIFGWMRFASCAPVQHFGRVRLASQLKRWANGHIMCCSRMDD